ncbi:hypothetical protein GCM10007304_23560 [Rhodococcoides trifolii]|uniref:AB hydrolase-1 domain-containing protein n=1 Tax=Rhodococcoides trifolii TaxID=908250 RepID=A0A917FWU9_9NOCA|nr:alpha/beta hydrolase [Rhodococcus trifolii]GGG08770.1 hypothetical protein GCM10007304_23560 [Rhodococcus trifolii]
MVVALGLTDVTLVGHDMGGMVAYSYLREHDLRQAVIMDVVIPGVPPWEQVLANPYIWHFAFHSIPGLPETLVAGRQFEYFGFFFENLATVPIEHAARLDYARAYDDPRALSAGFDFYRAFAADAVANAGPREVSAPLLYLRGDAEHGDIDAYAQGFQDNGIENVSTAIIGGSGHFAPDEAPRAVWDLIESVLR